MLRLAKLKVTLFFKNFEDALPEQERVTPNCAEAALKPLRVGCRSNDLMNESRKATLLHYALSVHQFEHARFQVVDRSTLSHY